MSLFNVLYPQMKSSAEEWHSRGMNLYEAVRFEFAAKAFMSAGDPVRSAMAGALHKRQQAKQMLDSGQSAEARQQYFEVCLAVHMSSKQFRNDKNPRY